MPPALPPNDKDDVCVGAPAEHEAAVVRLMGSSFDYSRVSRQLRHCAKARETMAASSMPWCEMSAQTPPSLTRVAKATAQTLRRNDDEFASPYDEYLFDPSHVALIDAEVVSRMRSHDSVPRAPVENGSSHRTRGSTRSLIAHRKPPVVAFGSTVHRAESASASEKSPLPASSARKKVHRGGNMSLAERAANGLPTKKVQRGVELEAYEALPRCLMLADPGEPFRRAARSVRVSRKGKRRSDPTGRNLTPDDVEATGATSSVDRARSLPAPTLSPYPASRSPSPAGVGINSSSAVSSKGSATPGAMVDPSRPERVSMSPSPLVSEPTPVHTRSAERREPINDIILHGSAASAGDARGGGDRAVPMRSVLPAEHNSHEDGAGGWEGAAAETIAAHDAAERVAREEERVLTWLSDEVMARILGDAGATAQDAVEEEILKRVLQQQQRARFMAASSAAESPSAPANTMQDVGIAAGQTSDANTASAAALSASCATTADMGTVSDPVDSDSIGIQVRRTRGASAAPEVNLALSGAGVGASPSTHAAISENAEAEVSAAVDVVDSGTQWTPRETHLTDSPVVVALAVSPSSSANNYANNDVVDAEVKAASLRDVAVSPMSERPPHRTSPAHASSPKSSHVVDQAVSPFPPGSPAGDSRSGAEYDIAHRASTELHSTGESARSLHVSMPSRAPLTDSVEAGYGAAGVSMTMATTRFTDSTTNDSTLASAKGTDDERGAHGGHTRVTSFRSDEMARATPSDDVTDSSPLGNDDPSASPIPQSHSVLYQTYIPTSSDSSGGMSLFGPDSSTDSEDAWARRRRARKLAGAEFKPATLQSDVAVASTEGAITGEGRSSGDTSRSTTVFEWSIRGGMKNPGAEAGSAGAEAGAGPGGDSTGDTDADGVDSGVDGAGGATSSSNDDASSRTKRLEALASSGEISSESAVVTDRSGELDSLLSAAAANFRDDDSHGENDDDDTSTSYDDSVEESESHGHNSNGIGGYRADQSCTALGLSEGELRGFTSELASDGELVVQREWPVGMLESTIFPGTGPDGEVSRGGIGSASWIAGLDESSLSPGELYW